MLSEAKQIELRDVRYLIKYWKVKREESESMVKSLLRKEKEILRSEEEDA
ncbi:hypothetical protein KAX97_05360 [candidate division WOR-3 bacterium]|nr:hypothetical protein [candidate division WOR-3 bacterium]